MSIRSLWRYVCWNYNPQHPFWLHKGVITSLTSKGVSNEIPKNFRFIARKGERPEVIVHCLEILSKQETSARLLNNFPSLLILPPSRLYFRSAEIMGVHCHASLPWVLTLVLVFCVIERTSPSKQECCYKAHFSREHPVPDVLSQKQVFSFHKRICATTLTTMTELLKTV